MRAALLVLALTLGGAACAPQHVREPVHVEICPPYCGAHHGGAQ